MFLSQKSALFANRSFLLLWGGRATSELGDFFGELALSWLVYAITGSALALVLNLIIFFVPRSAVRLYAGVYVDRLNRRNIMVSTEVARGLLFALIGFVNSSGTPSILLVYGISFFVGLLDALFDLASDAFLPLIVEKEQLLRANSIFTATFQIGSVLGPALAGLAIGLLGTSVPLLLDSASFFVLVFALLYIRNVPSIPPLATAGWLEQFREGIVFFKGRRGLIWLAAVVAGVNFGLAGFLNIYLLIFAKDLLMVGSLGWGFLSAMIAAGIFISSLIMARAGNVKHRRRFVTIPIVSLGLSMITFSLTNTFLASLLVIFALGFSIPFFDVVVVTFYQEVVPTHLMGRVFGVRRFINYALIPPGVIFGGFAVVYYGAAKAIFISGTVVLILGVATIFLKSLSVLDEQGKA